MQAGTRITRSPTARQASNAYVFSWVAVAVGGLAYLAVAAARPDLLSVILPLAEPATEQVVAGRPGRDVNDELASLRKWVHDLQHEVAETKSALNDQATYAQQLAQRVSIAESRLFPGVRDVRADAAPKALTQPAQMKRIPVPARTEPRPEPRASLPVEPDQKVAAAPAAAQPGLNILNGENASPIVTGSVATAARPAPVIGPAKVVPAPKAGAERGIVIGSSESLDSLRTRWGELSTRNSADLSGLSPRYRLAADGREAPFALLAGPFGSTAEAQRACTNLRAKGVACRVSDFAGSTF